MVLLWRDHATLCDGGVFLQRENQSINPYALQFSNVDLVVKENAVQNGHRNWILEMCKFRLGFDYCILQN